MRTRNAQNFAPLLIPDVTFSEFNEIFFCSLFWIGCLPRSHDTTRHGRRCYATTLSLPALANWITCAIIIVHTYLQQRHIEARILAQSRIYLPVQWMVCAARYGGLIQMAIMLLLLVAGWRWRSFMESDKEKRDSATFLILNSVVRRRR